MGDGVEGDGFLGNWTDMGDLGGEWAWETEGGEN